MGNKDLNVYEIMNIYRNNIINEKIDFEHQSNININAIDIKFDSVVNFSKLMDDASKIIRDKIFFEVKKYLEEKYKLETNINKSRESYFNLIARQKEKHPEAPPEQIKLEYTILANSKKQLKLIYKVSTKIKEQAIFKNWQQIDQFVAYLTKSK